MVRSMNKDRCMFMPSYRIFPVPESDDVHWLYYGLYYDAHLMILVHRKCRRLYETSHGCGYLSWDDHAKSNDDPS